MDESANKLAIVRQKKRRNPKDPPAEYRFKKGHHTKHTAAQNAGIRRRMLMNEMSNWTTERLEGICTANSTPHVRRAVAMQLLDERGENRTIAGQAFDRICDQTAGKPTQAVVLTGLDGGPIQSNVTIDYAKYANLFDE